MKKTVLGIFANRKDAEKAINYIHNKLSVDTADMSYLYRNTDNVVREVDPGSVSSDTPAEGAQKGAGVGAALGALAGIAATAGLIPIVGPFFAAGPILAAIGITGAAGATAAGAVGGAVAGGIIGGLANLGVGKERAKLYEDEVMAGNILVSVSTDQPKEVENALINHDATDVEAYSMKI